MAFPSLVRTIPPIGSKSILSMDFGPRVVLTMSETAYKNANSQQSLNTRNGMYLWAILANFSAIEYIFENQLNHISSR